MRYVVDEDREIVIVACDATKSDIERAKEIARELFGDDGALMLWGSDREEWHQTFLQGRDIDPLAEEGGRRSLGFRARS